MILNYLKKIKPVIGEFDSNYIELKKFLIERLLACDEDFKNKNIYPDLIINYIKLSKLFLMLTIFNINEKEIDKLKDMGNLKSITN